MVTTPLTVNKYNGQSYGNCDGSIRYSLANDESI